MYVYTCIYCNCIYARVNKMHMAREWVHAHWHVPARVSPRCIHLKYTHMASHTCCRSWKGCKKHTLRGSTRLSPASRCISFACVRVHAFVNACLRVHLRLRVRLLNICLRACAHEHACTPTGWGGSKGKGIRCSWSAAPEINRWTGYTNQGSHRFKICRWYINVLCRWGFVCDSADTKQKTHTFVCLDTA